VSAARTARARKLLSIEVQRVAVKERELAEARRAMSEAEQRVTEAEVEARAADQRWLDETSTELLAQASEHRRGLELRVELARRRVLTAAAEVKTREAAAIAARMAERRFEILIEGFERTEETRVRKAERRLGDEHAARRTGAS
jgi:hypothetical protein